LSSRLFQIVPAFMVMMVMNDDCKSVPTGPQRSWGIAIVGGHRTPTELANCICVLSGALGPQRSWGIWNFDYD
jgi:hypothetical protein